VITSVRFWPKLFGMLGASLLLGASLPTSAGATTYNESFSFRAANLQCGYVGTVELCTEVQPFAVARSAVTNDIYNIAVGMDQRLTIPGSNTSDIFLVNLLDSHAAFGPGGPGGDIAQSHINLQGYLGPANPISGGGTVAWDQGYFALAGFCCGYGAPNGGFSLTGADATIKLKSADPYPLTSMAVTMSVDLGYTPTVLTGFNGGGETSAIALPLGKIGSISNTLGGSNFGDYYLFDWQGGQFEAIGQAPGANPAGDFFFELFDTHHNFLQGQVLAAGNNFSGFINSALPAGRYVIGMEPGNGFDAEFKIQFLQPVTGIADPPGVPEPTTWALLMLGLGAIGYRLRRARASSTSGVAV
jgi:hypothetical protein